MLAHMKHSIRNNFEKISITRICTKSFKVNSWTIPILSGKNSKRKSNIVQCTLFSPVRVNKLCVFVINLYLTRDLPPRKTLYLHLKSKNVLWIYAIYN